jgi:hypothetical protein
MKPNNEFANVKIIESYKDFVDEISGGRKVIFGEERKSKKKPIKNTMWYRGQACYDWPLLPGVYRIIENSLEGKSWGKAEWEQLKRIEENRINLFKVRNYHHFKYDKPGSKYLWMCVMQHYQIKTRLLDWSESAEVAFFFALYFYFLEKDNLYPKFIKNVNISDNESVLPEPQISKEERKVKDSLPCVWVLDPYVFLKNDKNGSRVIPDLYNCPKDQFEKTLPTPVLSPYNNERIKAQSGTFVIFPINEVDQNRVPQFHSAPYFQNLPNSNKFLKQYIILHPDKCLKEIESIGSKLSLYYPEMPYLDDDIEKDLYNLKLMT